MDTACAFAYLNARIEPHQRESWYARPLREMLAATGWGEATGGGTKMNASGEIEGCYIELMLIDPDTAAPLVCSLLESHGAPSGSSLVIASKDGEKKVLPFGEREGVAIYLNESQLSGKPLETTDSVYVIDELRRLIGLAGLVEGTWQGPDGTALYAYGPYAKEMLDVVSGFIRTDPLCRNARLEIIA